MRQGTLASKVVVVALIALMAGCAGPITGAGPIVPASTTSTADLAGTWDGLFWALASFYFPVEGTSRLQINEDGTFTVTNTPTAAANNIAKPSTWSGTVTRSGNRLVFHLAKGQFPAWSSLALSGDTLYGVANDSSTGFDIGVKFERADRGTASGKTSGSGS